MPEHTRNAFTRRRFVGNSLLGSLSLTLPGLLEARIAHANRSRPRIAVSGVHSPIRACILVFYYGGPSHLDTFDLKPQASETVRGEFRPVSTSAPGVQICEHLPHLARVMHKAALIRSMHHTNRLHDSASTEVLTGRQSPQGDREEFAPIPQFFPCHGATLCYQWRDRGLDVAHAALPFMFHNVVDVPCQGGGFLGSAFDPLLISGDPERVRYRAEMLARPLDLSLERIAHRRRLLTGLEDRLRLAEATPGAGELRGLYERAYDLLGSEAVAQALDVTQESPSTRERYGFGGEHARGPTNGAEHGWGRNLRGQNLLLARRLVEAGVPFVNVYDFRQQGQNWDSHADNFRQHREHLLPPADRALAALIEDLDERGLLESTLVVATGEFGRTPQINASAGRDHWPDCYSLLLAGGGVTGGTVFGASDALGAYPSIDPVAPADLAATIFWRFGLDPSAEIHDRTGRPYRLADGRPIERLFG
ncbi:MAG TPA: DUF1501 domain-containing protein [Planctomycetaceae bacterium]|nr:DUF1501 domain-containing protein [Planctomycetaceae bacterium]